MSETTMEKARQVVHRLSEWYFAEGGDNDPDSPIDREDLDALHDLVRTAEATAEMERRQAGAYADVAAVVRRELEAPGAGEDVRERVAREVFALDADWRRGYWDQFRRECPRQAQAYYDTADRILGLCRAPRGDGEAWCEFLAEMIEFEAAANLWVDPEGPSAEDMARLDRARQRVIECTRVLAGLPSTEDAARRGEGEGDALGMLQASVDEYLWEAQNNPQFDAEVAFAALSREIRAARRSEANGKEADALDLIRWAESQAAALEPVAGNIMPPGTYACYAGDADDPYTGPGILGAIRAARRGGATWTWSKGRWGMTPQELLALCAESERDGVDYIVLKVATRREPGNRMRILPGVMAEVLDTGRGYAVVRAPARKVREVVERELTTHPTDRSEGDGE